MFKGVFWFFRFCCFSAFKKFVSVMFGVFWCLCWFMVQCFVFFGLCFVFFFCIFIDFVDVFALLCVFGLFFCIEPQALQKFRQLLPFDSSKQESTPNFLWRSLLVPLLFGLNCLSPS